MSLGVYPMPRISVKTQLLGSLLALIIIYTATVIRFYSYVKEGISIEKLYVPLALWIAVFVNYAFLIYLTYLKDIKKKHVLSYRIITYMALAILAICVAWAVVLEYLIHGI